MKKIGIIILLFVIISPVFGQRGRGYSSKKSTVKWFSIAPRVGYGAGIMLNSAVFEDPRIAGEKRSPATYIGGRFGFTHGDNIGLSFIGGLSSFEQNYNAYDINSIDKYTKSYELSAIEFGVLFRYTSDLGFIFEFGPQKVQLRSAYSIVGGNNLIEPENRDLMDTIMQSYTAISLAMGQALVRNERTELNLSVKVTYGLKDLFENSNYAYLEDNNYNASNPDFYDNYVNNFQSTNPLTILITLEFNYFFAFWGDASCGRGQFMMFQ